MSDYIDLPYSMEKNQYGDIDLKYDVAAVKQSIIDIIMTRKGEREFMPDYGSRIIYLLMEKITPITQIMIQNEIKTSLETWEPRITVNNINVEVVPNLHTYNVSINFEVLRLRQVEELNLKLQKLS